MKRLTWIPVVAGVVLLLIALPLFANDIVRAIQPEPEVKAVPAVLEGLSDRDFAVDDYELSGPSCSSSAETANPF